MIIVLMFKDCDLLQIIFDVWRRNPEVKESNTKDGDWLVVSSTQVSDMDIGENFY